MNYNFIINPLSNRKVKITTRLGKQIINNYLNYQLGGMHVALIYIGLKNPLEQIDKTTYEWISNKRLDKPKGFLTLIINKLSEQEDDIIVKKRIDNFVKNIDIIKEIKNSDLDDMEKNDKLMELLMIDEEDLPELEIKKAKECDVCGYYNCKRGVRCGRSYNPGE